MFRKLIAGTAVAGALTLGAAGVAGGATSNAGAATPRCAHVVALKKKLRTYGHKEAALLPKAEANEAKDREAGKTRRADLLAEQITRVQDHETQLHQRLSKAEAACGTSRTPGST